jgi:YD repeat-containing protein
VRGRKTASSDPDLGTWTYAYDTLAELVSQTDAKSQTTTLAYDKLGRMTGRVEPAHHAGDQGIVDPAIEVHETDVGEHLLAGEAARPAAT